MTTEAKTSHKPDLAKFFERVGLFAFGIVRELYLGIRFNFVPWNWCMAGSILFCCLINTGLDRRLFEWIHLGKLYPTSPIPFFTYLGLMTTGGFWIWAFFHWVWKQRRSRVLERAFCESGLRSSQGRVPKLIFEKESDDQIKVLRVTVAGANLDKFRKAKDSIESNLRIYIDDIREIRSKGAIEIIHSPQEMPRLVRSKNIASLPPCRFFIGETRTSVVSGDIRNVPHLLVAGQTGGGKSTFLRQFIATHYLNLPGSHFTLIDLKEGLEFRLFNDLPNVKIFETVKDAVVHLKNQHWMLETRLTTIKKADCVDFDQYVEKCGAGSSMKRAFIVVDEAAELFLAGGTTRSNDAQEARRILGDIARRGRAAGVHLVVATQRPDLRSLDPQVKANLPGVLCFQMVNDASSVMVLGVGRATDLPAIRGRAIWKEGARMIEIQTPLLTDAETLALLEPLKKRNRVEALTPKPMEQTE